MFASRYVSYWYYTDSDGKGKYLCECVSVLLFEHGMAICNSMCCFLVFVPKKNLEQRCKLTLNHNAIYSAQLARWLYYTVSTSVKMSVSVYVAIEWAVE